MYCCVEKAVIEGLEKAEEYGNKIELVVLKVCFDIHVFMIKMF